MQVLAVTNTFHVSVFLDRIRYNILDHKLENNPNDPNTPTTESAEANQTRTRLLIDNTKQNIMHSYLKYKESHGRKARAAPLKGNDYCFVKQSKTDHHRSKMPFRDYRWVVPLLLQNVLPNKVYIIRQLNTIKR